MSTSNNRFDALDAEDDLVAMERSCLRTFIGPEQLGTLLESWHRQEYADNLKFLQEFAPDFLLEEEDAIGWDDELYDEDDDLVDEEPGAGEEIIP